jgi:DNA-directed RNA polymerase alpha subunit
MTPQELIALVRRISDPQWKSLSWLMTTRERMVIERMCRRSNPTLARAARELKVTPERIRQIYHKGLRSILWKIKKMKALGEYDFILNPEPIYPSVVKLDLPIEYLELPHRVRNCFFYTGHKTIKEVVNMTENDLLAIKNFGATSLFVLKKRLSDLGLELNK